MFSEPLCAGDLAEIEAYVTTVERTLATEMQEPVDVQLWHDADPPDVSPCPKGLEACYVKSEHALYAGFASLHHELVHAVASGLGNPNAYLTEGIAVGLDLRIVLFPGVNPRTQLGLDEGHISPTSGAHFTRWLLDVFGASKWRQLYSKGGRTRDFLGVYGISFDDIVDEYLSTSPWVYAPLFVWQTPELLPGLTGWRESVEFDCKNEDTLGRSNALAVVRRLQIHEAGYYDIWTTADSLLLTRSINKPIKSIEEAIESTGSDLPVSTDETPLGGIIVVQPETLTVVQLDPDLYEVALVDAGRDSVQAEVMIIPHLGPVEVRPRSL